MKPRWTAPVLVLLWCSLVPVAAAGDNMRCGTHLVRSGDTKFEVLRRCGEPELKEIVSGADEPRVEQWYYDRGARQFPRVLTFRGLELVRIETVTRP